MPSHPLRLIALTFSTPLFLVCSSNTLPVLHTHPYHNSLFLFAPSLSPCDSNSSAISSSPSHCFLTLSNPLCPVCDLHTLPIYHPSTHNNSYPSHFGRNFHFITYCLPLSPPSTLVCTANTPIPVLHTPHNTPHQSTFYTTPSIVLIGPLVSPMSLRIVPSSSARLHPLSMSNNPRPLRSSQS